MIAMQYSFTLPADYDMGIIDRRIRDRGPGTDGLPHLGFKAYLSARKGEFGSAENLYAPFYLWQQPFLNRGSNTWWTAFPQNLVLALVCAMGSYYGVEKPFLELRERRKQRAAVGRGKRRVASERGRVSAREIA